MRWMQQRWRQVVRVQWLLGGLSRVGVGLGGPFFVDVVAGQRRFFVDAGRSLVVGGVVEWSAWCVVLPPQALVLFVHGGLWPGGVGWWAVVLVVVGVVPGVVVGMWVVVVVGQVAGALVAVALVVVVKVLWVCS